MHYSIYCVLYRKVHLLVLTTLLIKLAIHGINNKKMINAQQAITIHHYKNTKLPEG